MQQISVSADSDAPVSVLWEVIADAPRYPEWSALDSASYEREGSPAPHGTGAVRVFGSGRYTLREEVTGFAPHDALDYKLLSGMPVKGYTSRISTSERPGGRSRLEWTASFDSRLPLLGGLIAKKLQGSLGDLARAAAAEANRRA